MNKRTNFLVFKIEFNFLQPFSLMEELGCLMDVNWIKEINLFFSIPSILYKFMRHKQSILCINEIVNNPQCAS
jgi:hypothetical protein